MSKHLVCRICLSKEELQISVFSAYSDKCDILSKIKMCLPIKIRKTDNLPKTICYECLKNINSFYEFFCKSIRSDKKLKKRNNTSNNIPDSALPPDEMKAELSNAIPSTNVQKAPCEECQSAGEGSEYAVSAPSEIPPYCFNTDLDTDENCRHNCDKLPKKKTTDRRDFLIQDANLMDEDNYFTKVGIKSKKKTQNHCHDRCNKGNHRKLDCCTRCICHLCFDKKRNYK